MSSLSNLSNLNAIIRFLCIYFWSKQNQSRLRRRKQNIFCNIFFCSVIYDQKASIFSDGKIIINQYFCDQVNRNSEKKDRVNILSLGTLPGEGRIQERKPVDSSSVGMVKRVFSSKGK